jgi:hypothetical protein
MKTRASNPLVWIAAVALFACAPPPSPPPPGGGPTLTAQACNAATFLNKVHYLDTSQSFSIPGSGLANAPPIDPTPISQPIQDDLTQAFSAAPSFFQDDLCKLDVIYIDPTGCANLDPTTCFTSEGDLNRDVDAISHSWGFRAFDDSGKSRGRFIGTSLALWRNNGHAPQFDEYQTRRIQALLYKLATNSTKDQHPPKHHRNPGHPVVDTHTTSVLAALTHEFGHVSWYDTFVTTPGGPANTYTGTGFCFGTFYSNSWINNNVTAPMGRWVSFSDIRNQQEHRSSGIDANDLRSLLNQGDGQNQRPFRLAGDFLGRLHSNKEWASSLAAFSPDEDFVETFQLFVLLWADPSLSSPITITGTQGGKDYDIPGTWASQPTLRTKMSCFGGLPPTAQPQIGVPSPALKRR